MKITNNFIKMGVIFCTNMVFMTLRYYRWNALFTMVGKYGKHRAYNLIHTFEQHILVPNHLESNMNPPLWFGSVLGRWTVSSVNCFDSYAQIPRTAFLLLKAKLALTAVVDLTLEWSIFWRFCYWFFSLINSKSWSF